MQTTSHGTELRQLGDGCFQCREVGMTVWLGIDERTGDEIGENPDPVHRLDSETGVGEQVRKLFLGETRRQRIVLPETPLPVPESTPRLGEMPTQRTRDDCRRPVRRQHADDTAGTERVSHDTQAYRRIIGHLKHPVTQHEIDGTGLDEVEKAGEVALHRAQRPFGKSRLRGPALQRRERVGTRINDDDPVPELGDRHREPAGTAADIEDVTRTGRIENGT
jgi:hypothetical protein